MVTGCGCPSCRGAGPEHETEQANRGNPPTRPYRSTTPPPPDAWWRRVEAASNVNTPDDPTIYTWPTKEAS